MLNHLVHLYYFTVNDNSVISFKIFSMNKSKLLVKIDPSISVYRAYSQSNLADELIINAHHFFQFMSILIIVMSIIIHCPCIFKINQKMHKWIDRGEKWCSWGLHKFAVISTKSILITSNNESRIGIKYLISYRIKKTANETRCWYEKEKLMKELQIEMIAWMLKNTFEYVCTKCTFWVHVYVCG